MNLDPGLLSIISKLTGAFSQPAQPGLDTSRLDPVQQNQIDNPVVNDPNVDPTLDQRINEMLTTRHDASDQLQELAKNAPDRANYAPGKLRQTGAFLANLGSGGPEGIAGGQPIGYRSNPAAGFKTQQMILDDPYNNAVSDYEMRLKPISLAAENENRLNVNNRIAGTSLLTNERRIKADENLATHRDNQDQATFDRNEISRQRALAYDYKSRHAGTKSFIDDNGMVVFVSPDGSIQQTGLHQDKLSDADKLALQIEGRLKVVEAQSTANKELEDKKEGNRKELEDKKAGNKKDLKTTPPAKAAGTDKPLTPSAESKALMNKYGKIISEHPEYKGYYEVKNGIVSVKKAGLFGNEDTRKKAYEALMGKSEVGSATAPKTTDRITIYDKNSGQPVGTIPNTPQQIELAKKNYKLQP